MTVKGSWMKAVQRANDRLLNYALRRRGYNNYHNSEESGEAFFIRSILAPTNPKLCIDVGANIGEYTAELLASTSATVVSFEPLSESFLSLCRLRESLEESGRLILENKGIANRDGSLTIHFNRDALAHASFSEDVKKVSYVSNPEKLAVPVVTLDTYCLENRITEIDLVKIDTEGFELEVFEGAEETFRRLRPKFIQIEFNWHQMFRDTSLNFFAEKLPAYDLYQLLPKSWIKRDPRDPLANIYLFSNFVFVRPD
jgi:FkbM family methyltransferase